MNHLLFIPIFYFIFVTTIICLIHTFVPDYPMNRINIFSPYKEKSRQAFRRRGRQPLVRL